MSPWADATRCSDEGAASNDLLFSRKLSNAGELVPALAHRLIDAARQGDYQSTALQAFVGIQNSIVHLNDRITREPILLSAIRISGTPTLVSGCCNRSLPPSPPARSTMPSPGPGIRTSSTRSTGSPTTVSGCRSTKAISDILNFALERCHEVEIGNLSSSDAARQIFAQLAAADFVPPIFDFADPDARVYQLTTWRKLKALWWGLVKVPSEVGRLIFYRPSRNPSMRKES